MSKLENSKNRCKRKEEGAQYLCLVYQDVHEAVSIIMKMADERNFRLPYYEQLGLRNVDQVKALEHLLKDEKLDIVKLSTFALKYTLHSSYRPFIWKVLLGVLPSYQTSHKFAEQCREEQFQDLERALLAMRMITKRDSIQNKILWMYLLENDMISMSKQRTLQRDERKVQIIKAIAEVCCDVAEHETDAYWITKRFLEMQDKYVDLYRNLPKFVTFYLEVEDKALFEHMNDLQVFKVMPYNRWFESCFAEIFPTCGLGRVWDKLVAGSCNILVFMCVAILLSCRLSLLETRSAEASVHVLRNLPKDRSRQLTAVDKSLQLWDKHRSTISVELGAHSDI